MDAASDRELRVLSKRRRVIEARLRQPARVILLAASGWESEDNDVEVALDTREVTLWCQRFLQGGFDAPRRHA